jgi:ABC-type oligopeptide transport system ATPase subunit
MKQEQPILVVEGLRQYFKSGFGKRKVVVKAVDDVSFHINKGEVFGLVGESGCGKTTTGRSIIKLYQPDGGKVYFKNELISEGFFVQKQELDALLEQLKDKELDDSKKTVIQERVHQLRSEIARIKRFNRKAVNRNIMNRMQMIFQDPIASLNPRMTVKEIIAEGLRINGIKDEEIITQKVHQALETVGLVREHANRYPHEFSGGQRQRIGVARSMVIEPELIIADEPISALDVSIQAQVINLLNELRERLGLTILFIAHDLSVVKYFSDRIAVMYYGKIVELTTSDELFNHPLHPYTRSLLSAVPRPDPDSEKVRQRVRYNPAIDHDYSKEQPSMVEIRPGHFVYASASEIKKYKAMLEESAPASSTKGLKTKTA